MSKAALPGFRDFYPGDFAERASIFRVWREVARRYAFVEWDGPPLEPLELYTRKSGEEIVGQLYNFTDKGGREIALRPELTPSLARVVGARANALRKPVRWFSIPQLFRYERQQKGRLREHFQLNVDIIGEVDVTADAELLAVALDIMRGFGLTPDDVRARVSDRRLLRALLAMIGVGDAQMAGTFAVVDKIERQPRDVSAEKLAALGLDARAVSRLFGLMEPRTLADLIAEFGAEGTLGEIFADFTRYFRYLRELGVADYVTLDLTIVRGLAYYTGIVFELFDARGEFRAICGGGRYDNLLQSLGGIDLPALGFGMGDVVIGELLRARGLMRAESTAPEFWVIGAGEDPTSAAMTAATRLRRAGASVEYALRSQNESKQRKAAFSAGAACLVSLAGDFAGSDRITVASLATPSDSARQQWQDRITSANPETLSALIQVLKSATDAPVLSPVSSFHG